LSSMIGSYNLSCAHVYLCLYALKLRQLYHDITFVMGLMLFIEQTFVY
jgi:hypothetical protein